MTGAEDKSEGACERPLTPADLLDKWRIGLAIASDRKLSRGDVVVALHLLDHFNVARGAAWPSVATLARKSNLATSSAMECVKRLEAAGYIHRVGGGKGRSNRYTIGAEPYRSTGIPDHTGAPVRTIPVHRHTPYRSTGHEPLNTPVVSNVGGEEVVSPAGVGPALEAPGPAAGAPPQPEGFELFWTAYPRQEGRKSAIVAYKAAIASGLRPELLEQKAAQYALAKSGNDPKWIKMPANWLKDEGWLEDPQPPKPKTKREDRKAPQADRRLSAAARPKQKPAAKTAAKAKRKTNATRPMPAKARSMVPRPTEPRRIACPPAVTPPPVKREPIPPVRSDQYKVRPKYAIGVPVWVPGKCDPCVLVSYRFSDKNGFLHDTDFLPRDCNLTGFKVKDERTGKTTWHPRSECLFQDEDDFDDCN